MHCSEHTFQVATLNDVLRASVRKEVAAVKAPIWSPLTARTAIQYLVVALSPSVTNRVPASSVRTVVACRVKALSRAIVTSYWRALAVGRHLSLTPPAVTAATFSRATSAGHQGERPGAG